MNILLISLIPLVYWGCQFLFQRESLSIKALLIPFFKGSLLAIPMILLYWIVDVYLKLRWTALGAFFYTYNHKEGFLSLLVIFILALSFRKGRDISSLRYLLAYLSGYFYLISLVDFFNITNSTSYEILMLPLFRVLEILSFSYCLDQYSLFMGSLKKGQGVLLLLILVAITLLFNIIPLLTFLHHPGLSFLFFILFFLGSIYFFLCQLYSLNPFHPRMSLSL